MCVRECGGRGRQTTVLQKNKIRKGNPQLSNQNKRNVSARVALEALTLAATSAFHSPSFLTSQRAIGPCHFFPSPNSPSFLFCFLITSFARTSEM